MLRITYLGCDEIFDEEILDSHLFIGQGKNTVIYHHYIL